jgi:site-specific DNA-methyltransferase (adenine-specific)
MQCIYTIGSTMQDLGFWLVNDVIWHKKNPTPNFMGTRLNNSHETLIWATKSKKSKYTFNYKTAKELNVDSVTEDEYSKGVRKQMGSVWRFPVCSGLERLKDENGEKLHSTQKPLEMLERIIAISSKKGDLVLDPFGGTMTTGVAAKKLGRNYIMLEREPKYCKFGEQRLNETVYIDTPIANAVYDEKPLKVSMEEMITAGVFVVGEDFCFKNGEPVAKLCADGKLEYNGEILDMHTCCAVARQVKANRLNGFDYWYVIRENKPVAIADIREEYRKTKQQ